MIVAGFLLLSLTCYVLTGGADYGAGVWYLFANGPRSRAQRALIHQALALFPHLVPPDLTIFNAAAPTATLQALAVALIAGALLLFPALYYLLRVFKHAAVFGESRSKPPTYSGPQGGIR